MPIVIRCGDADDYHPFDSTEEAAEYLNENYILVTPLERNCKFGVVDQGDFVGRNYISIYRGNWPIEDTATLGPIEDFAEITDDELADLNRSLDERKRDE